MEFRLARNLWKNSYFLSDPSCFLYRHADSGFKSKWSGLWHRETKFLDFFAFRDRGEWLSERACRRFRYDGAEAVHEFRTRHNEIRQRLHMDGAGRLVVELSAKRPLKLDMVLAVNIRKRTENRTPRSYLVTSTPRKLKVYNELGSLTVSCRDMLFQESPEYREHSPSSEPQNYFMPGSITARGKEVTFLLKPAVNSKRKPALPRPRHAPNGFRDLIKSDNKTLERGFYWSALATGFCRKSGPGLVSWYAGLPWFQHFWARDIFWVMPSLISLGFLEDVRKTLLHFGKNSQEGRIPNLVSETEGSHMNALDPTPLWLISLHDYILNSGDLVALRRMRPAMESSTRYLLSCDTDSDGYIEHDSRFPETWMDTLKRDTRAIDMQALFYRAMLCSSRLLSLCPGKTGLLEDVSSVVATLESRLEDDYFQKGFFSDRFFYSNAVAMKTANALVPMLCGLRRHEKEVLDVIESGLFTTKRGVRTRAGGESGFDPGGYHTGQAWSLTTAWACAAEFLASRPSRAWRYLRLLLDDIDRDALGCIGECWNSSNLSLSGCPLQLWGSGFVPRLVDDFMLGIGVNSLERTITLSPRLPPAVKSVERLRQTGLGPVRLAFRRSGKSLHISCSNKRFRLLRQ